MKKNKKRIVISLSILFIIVSVIAIVSFTKQNDNNNDKTNKNNSSSDNTESSDIQLDDLLNNEAVMEKNLIVPLEDGSYVAAMKEEYLNPDEINDNEFVFYYTDDKDDPNKHELHTFRKTPEMTNNMVNILENRLHKSSRIYVKMGYSMEIDGEHFSSDIVGYDYDNTTNIVKFCTKDNEDGKPYNIGDTIEHSSFKVEDFKDSFAFLEAFMKNAYLPFDFDNVKPMNVDTFENNYEFLNTNEDVQNKYTVVLNALDKTLDVETVDVCSYATLNHYEYVQDLFLSFMTNEWTIVTTDGKKAILRATYSIYQD